MSLAAQTINSRLLPYRQIDERNDVINSFASADDNTLVGGSFVKITVSDPSNPEGFSSDNVGGSYQGTWSKRFKVNGKIAPAEEGDTIHDVLGVTLYGAYINDPNGDRLEVRHELMRSLQVVLPWMAIPVVTRGVITLTSDAYTGTPAVNRPAIIDSTSGKIAFTASPADDNLVVGRALSVEGSEHGGFVIFQLRL